MIYIVLDNQKAEKTLSRQLHSKLKKIQELFKYLHRNLRTFQGLPLNFKDFSRLCEPCYIPFLTQKVTCQKSHFSSLLAAGDVSRGGTSAFQRQKFHTDGVKSVWNPIISAG